MGVMGGGGGGGGTSSPASHLYLPPLFFVCVCMYVFLFVFPPSPFASPIIHFVVVVATISHRLGDFITHVSFFFFRLFLRDSKGDFSERALVIIH